MGRCAGTCRVAHLWSCACTRSGAHRACAPCSVASSVRAALGARCACNTHALSPVSICLSSPGATQRRRAPCDRVHHLRCRRLGVGAAGACERRVRRWERQHRQPVRCRRGAVRGPLVHIGLGQRGGGGQQKAGVNWCTVYGTHRPTWLLSRVPSDVFSPSSPKKAFLESNFWRPRQRFRGPRRHEAEPAGTTAPVVGRRRLVACEEDAAGTAARVRGRHGHERDFRQTEDVPGVRGGWVWLVPEPKEVRWFRHRGLR